MTVIGIDDTDSRERGMCTTFVAARLAADLRTAGATARPLLVRLNPAVPYKTRGNAALAIQTDCAPAAAFDRARNLVDELAETADPRTDPGVVVAPDAIEAIPAAVDAFARRAVHDHLSIAAARECLAAVGYRHASWKDGRGLVGALAAVGAGAAFEEWTYEHIRYRPPDRWGTPRELAYPSVLEAATAGYPAVWDTVDREEEVAVCVPRTPCPVRFGIRGETPSAVESVADAIAGAPVGRAETFVTNQGTDAHLRDGNPATVVDGRSYRVTADVVDGPTTEPGGHVFLTVSDGDASLRCVAFEPTKRFRDHVRALQVGDRVTVCGEVADGTLKLEKFGVRSLVRTERVVPDCPSCGRSMESAGRDQGYRCRDCSTSTPDRVTAPLDRSLDHGWYEVPPCARRHLARPLVRGGFDAPTHPER